MVLSTSVQEAINAQQTADSPAILITITDDSLADPLRLTSAALRLTDYPLRYGLVSGGETYSWVVVGNPFPNDKEKEPEAVTLTLENVSDEDIATTVRGLGPSARVTLSVVMMSDPDTVIKTSQDLKIADRNYNAETVALDLSRRVNGAEGSDEEEFFAAHRQTRTRAPGLHR